MLQKNLAAPKEVPNQIYCYPITLLRLRVFHSVTAPDKTEIKKLEKERYKNTGTT